MEKEQQFYDLMVMYQQSDRTKHDLGDYFFRTLCLLSIGSEVEERRAVSVILKKLAQTLN